MYKSQGVHEFIMATDPLTLFSCIFLKYSASSYDRLQIAVFFSEEPVGKLIVSTKTRELLFTKASIWHNLVSDFPSFQLHSKLL